MKLLSEILYKAPITEVSGNTNVFVADISFNTATITENSVYVAVRGLKVNGHQFIDEAIRKGACAIVCEQLPEKLLSHITYVRVRNSREALAYLCSNFFDNPSQTIKLIGITGTNGKTTCATLLYQLFTELGIKCGLISTVKIMIGAEHIEATHTTPDAYALNMLLHTMAKSDCQYCFMEVSSHAVAQHRVTGIHFTGALFTNITHDHLDFHRTFANYLEAKKGLFDALSAESFALVNADDKNSRVMLQNCKARQYTYSLKSDSNFKCKIIENTFNGLLLQIDGKETLFRLIGSFNAYNLSCIYATTVLLGIDSTTALVVLSKLQAPEGRFQYYISKRGITGIVDYAHTPDALENVLTTIKDIRTASEQVITVVGCGGDRDVAKRPEMARIACDFSDKVILTSDNPRTELPEKILAQMQEGVIARHAKKTLTIADRSEAIKAACAMANNGDIILVAGKGHEKYQEIMGVRTPFDDMEFLTQYLSLYEL